MELNRKFQRGEGVQNKTPSMGGGGGHGPYILEQDIHTIW